MFSQIAKYLTVLLLSTFKFILGPISGAAAGLTWLETCIFTVAGMMISVLLVSLLGASAKEKLFSRFQKKKKKLFTPRNRRIVRIWRKYGLKGVAFLTPILLTPIGGTVIAVSFGESKKRIFFFMLVSAIVWGVIFSLFIEQLNTLILHRLHK